MIENWRRIVYVCDDANDRFGHLLVGPGCMPVEYLERLKQDAQAIAACRTVGDVRGLPDGLSYFTNIFDPREEVQVPDDVVIPGLVRDGDDPVEGADVPDDLVLWDGWSDSDPDSEYQYRSYLPWERDTPFDYVLWMPAAVLSMADAGTITSPMQETARWSFEDVEVADIIAAFEAAGWEVRRDDDAMCEHLVIPW